MTMEKSIVRRLEVARELERLTKVPTASWLNSLMSIEDMEKALAAHRSLEEAHKAESRKHQAAKDVIKRVRMEVAMVSTQKKRGTARYGLCEVDQIKIRKSTSRSLIYKGWLSKDIRRIYGMDDLRNTMKEIQEGRIKPIRWKTEIMLHISIKMKDGTEIPQITVLGKEIPGLFKGDLQSDGFRRIYSYEFGGLAITEFDTDGDGTYLKHHIDIPMQILRSAIHRALHKPHDYRFEAISRFRITDRHQMFFSPNATIRFHGDAEDVYTRHQDDKAGCNQVLRDQVEGLLQTARNNSANKLDPVTLNLSREDEKSFYFWFTDKEGKRRSFNGGIIWHASSGEYGVHT